MTKYTLSDVAQHKSKDDLWFVIHGKVYDVTKFGDDHPGGLQSLLDEAGGDATNAFEDVGHSNEARELLAQYYIGDLEVAPVIPSTSASAQIPPTNKDSPTPQPPASPKSSSSTNHLLASPIFRAVVFVAVPVVLLFVYKRYLNK